MARNAALLLLAVGAAASPAAERDGGKITLENFGRAAHEWQELNDPVMGGQSVATFGIAGGVGVFNGTCAIVPSLSAPGFCSAQTKQKLFGDSWPDASAALAGGLVLVARSTTPWFAGFKVAFGAKDVPSASRYTPQGTFKAPFNVTGVAGDDGFEEIYVPFSSFSWDWSPFTGLRRRPAISAGKNIETPRDRTNRRSTRGDYDLGEATTPRVDTWWISKSFDPGQNAGWREWLAFDVSPDGRPRRVTCVGVRIPPMPFGPLSVREFTVEGAAPSGEFRESRAVYETLDRSDLQEFVLDPPLETTRVRVTARSTAVPTASNCGLFQVYFR